MEPSHTLKSGSEIRTSCWANQARNGRPCPLHCTFYVKDVDAAYRRAIEAGATSVMEPANQFYGDRNAGVKDASGNFWWIATHVEDVAPDELKRRAEAQFRKASGA